MFDPNNPANVPFTIKKNKSGFSIASLIFSLVPFVIVMLGFLFYFIYSSIAPSSEAVVGWVILIGLMIAVYSSPLTGILSVVFGVIGIKSNKKLFSWLGITIGLLTFAAAAFPLWNLIGTMNQ